MSWKPRPSSDSCDGLIWFPRMLDKARRAELSRTSNADLMDGYLYGDNDFIDAQVLKFLGISDTDFTELALRHDDDGAVLQSLLARHESTIEERQRFSAQLKRRMLGFAMLDADEKLMQPGIRRTVIAFAYNRLMMPVVYAVFRRAERRRSLGAMRTAGPGALG